MVVPRSWTVLMLSRGIRMAICSWPSDKFEIKGRLGWIALLILMRCLARTLEHGVWMMAKLIRLAVLCSVVRVVVSRVRVLPWCVAIRLSRVCDISRWWISLLMCPKLVLVLVVPVRVVCSVVLVRLWLSCRLILAKWMMIRLVLIQLPMLNGSVSMWLEARVVSAVWPIVLTMLLYACLCMVGLSVIATAVNGGVAVGLAVGGDLVL